MVKHMQSNKLIVLVAFMVVAVGCLKQEEPLQQAEVLPDISAQALEQPVSVPYELIVELGSGIDPAALQQALVDLKPVWKWIGPQEHNLVLLTFPDTVDMDAAATRIQALDGIENVQPNFIMQIQESSLPESN